VNPGISHIASPATPVIVNSTSPSPKNSIDRRFVQNSFQLICHAAPYKIGGKKSVNMTHHLSRRLQFLLGSGGKSEKASGRPGG
jgi:hypothetical protein